MKPNPFNICPSCMHVATCVLTNQKHLVWSCSEYDELIVKSMANHKMDIIQINDSKHSNTNLVVIRNDLNVL